MSAHSIWLNIVLTLFTGIEAWAFVLLYRLERGHFGSEAQREQNRDRVEVSVEVEFVTGGPEVGDLVIWVENSGPGTAFIRSVALVVTHLTDQRLGAREECSLFGNRTLPGFSSARIPVGPAMQALAGRTAWVKESGAGGFALTVAVVVRTVEDRSRTRDSRRYHAVVSGSGESLTSLHPASPAPCGGAS